MTVVITFLNTLMLVSQKTIYFLGICNGYIYTGKVKGYIYELWSLSGYSWMQAVSGRWAPLDLYKSSAVSSLLYNNNRDQQEQDQAALWATEHMMLLPISTPKASLRAVFGLLAWAREVLLVSALSGHEDGGMAAGQGGALGAKL